MQEALRALIHDIPEDHLAEALKSKKWYVNSDPGLQRPTSALSLSANHKVLCCLLSQEMREQIVKAKPGLELHEAAGMLLDEWIDLHGTSEEWWEYIAMLVVQVPNATKLTRMYMRKDTREILRNRARIFYKKVSRGEYRVSNMDTLARAILFYELNKEQLTQENS